VDVNTIMRPIISLSVVKTFAGHRGTSVGGQQTGQQCMAWYC